MKFKIKKYDENFKSLSSSLKNIFYLKTPAATNCCPLLQQEVFGFPRLFVSRPLSGPGHLAEGGKTLRRHRRRTCSTPRLSWTGEAVGTAVEPEKNSN
jgi:hypothetical protein